MLSSNASNFIEKTLSQSHSQLILKSFRGIEEEIVAKVNHFRLKISHVKDKLELLIKESSNPEDCTITIKEINKTIKYESQENLDKLMSYLSYLSELKHTIPDFCYAPYLNSVFTRNFSSTVDTQKGLLQKSTDNNEKLKRLIPSRNYLGIYIPDLELKDIESILCFIILEEFLMLSSKDARLKSDNLTIEINNEEVPQHISIFNPSFNTLVAYACEREQHLYLLFLTDVLELMGPDNAEFPYGSKIDFFDSGRKPKFSKALTRIEADKLELTGKKYDNLKTTLPDISLEQAERFIRFLDHDHDHKITIEDVTNFAKKHKLVLDDSAINKMFEEIFQRRSVIAETQRRNPIDAYEVYHAVRYKYKKDQETNNWVPSAREHRDTWLMLFKLAGIELPKHTLPPIKTLPLLCNYEYSFPSLKATQKMNKTQSAYVIREPKPEILKKQYKPEANILIQNTQNIMELYIDDREHNKPEDSNKNAFQTLVNAKFKDLTQKTEYQTVEFSTQGYYKEALRLSKDPETYLHEKINPIFRFVPVRKDYVYHQNVQELESLKDTRSAMQTDEMELDVSVEPNNGSKRVTMYSIREFPIKSIKSAKSFKPSNVLDTQIIQGSLRPLALSSSMKERMASPLGQKSNKPIFYTSFKIPDNETLRMNVAKLEPIVDSYNPPKNYNFRTDLPPEDKPQFITNWHKEIPDVIKDPYATDVRPRELVDQERYAREMHEMRLKGVKRDVGPWVNYFKLAPKERGFVDFKYPDFLEKGDYQDGFIRGATFIRPEVETDVPFKLVHRALRKTDKNLTFGDDVPTKGF